MKWDGGEVETAWHRPSASNGTVFVLAHGAGGNMHTPQLKAFADGLLAYDIATMRFNFAYAEAKKKAPDRTPVLEAVWRAAAAEARGEASKLIFAGRSMGGRIGSHLASQDEPCDGLVFLAYPLHPPGKPEKLRDEHLANIKQPMLFLQGDRDPFAEPDLLTATLERLPNATLHTVVGGDHGHKVSGRKPSEVVDELVRTTVEWLG